MNFIKHRSFMNFTKLLVLLVLLSPLTQTMSSNERKCYVLRPPNENILYAFSAVQSTNPDTGRITYHDPLFLKEEQNIAIPPNLESLCIEGNVFPAIASFNHLLNQKDTISFFYDKDGTYHPMERKNSSDLFSFHPCYKCKRQIHGDHDLLTFVASPYARIRYNLCLNCASDEMEPNDVEQALKEVLMNWRDPDNQVNDKLDEGIINYIYEYGKPHPILPKHVGSRFKIVKPGQEYSLTFKITVGVVIIVATMLLLGIAKIYVASKKNIKKLPLNNNKQKELEQTFLESANKQPKTLAS